MTTFLTSLLVGGLIFPALSLFSWLIACVDRLVHKRNSSAIFIPIIGPVLLTCWVVLADEPIWWALVFWLTDLGTLAFLAVSPQLLRDWWRTSSFTRVLTLHGSHENQAAVISLHSTGHYLLRKSWSRPLGQAGVVGLGEPAHSRRLRMGMNLRRISVCGVSFTEWMEVRFALKNWNFRGRNIGIIR